MDRQLFKLMVRGSSALLLAGLTAFCGCESADPGTPPPVAGGQEFILDEAVFAATVNPILTRKGCDNLACHGGGLRGSLQLSPFNDKNVDFDFEQVSRQLNPLDPEASSIAGVTDLEIDGTAISGGGLTGGSAGNNSGGGGELRSSESLLTVVRRYAPGIQFCYENELKKSPGLGGKMVVSLTVEPDGTVSSVILVEDSLRSAAVSDCVTAQMRGWKFPAIETGMVTFKTPFVFTPPD